MNVSTEKETTKKNEDYEKVVADYTKGMRPFRKKEYEKAAEMLREFIDKHSSEGEFVDRARIYLSIARDRMKKEEISLKSFEDYYQYAIYKANQKDFEEALKALQKAQSMKPKEGKIPYLAADVYALMGKEEECLEHLKKAVQIDKYFGILAQNEEDFAGYKENKKFKLITRLK